ncbi:cellulase family glycosylhydrolase [Streptacidiphilus rugosus]|uniref:cellulase family glycosylhydrolase n=1 Tax=Streptacidiphilus rugosus TaxID=405783 RepID=UPI001E59369A|nr:cellulase family glycosylhydrolase [Streptacidiphilus rugosus]
MSNRTLPRSMRTVLPAVAAGALLAGALALPGSARAAGAVGQGYWHTSGSTILDAAGNPVRIAGINWYGFETPDAVAHGLWSADYKALIDDMRNLGYNTVRIPFSNQMVETNPVPNNLGYYGQGGPINTDLKGLTSLQILDRIIAYAGQDNLKVILDDHRSEAGNSAEQNGLWYTGAYPASAWLADWNTMAKRYAGNSTVIGFDLRNEPHTPAYTAYSAGATWGSGDPATDWRLAAQTAGNAVEADDPGALVFVEGISNYPDASVSGGYSTDWWGGNLDGAGTYPVTLDSPGHVVYSAHDYGPHEYAQTWFNSGTTPAGLDAVWDKHWGYLAKQNIAPVWVGEFGTPNAATDAADSTPGSQGQWFSSLVSYIKGNGLSWTYWALNGEDAYGLLDNGYDPTPVSAPKQAALNTVEFPFGPGPGGGSPSPSASSGPSGTPSTSPSPSASAGAGCQVTYTRQSEWAGGFNGVVDIKNTGATAVNGWTLGFTFGGDQKITNPYNAAVTQSGAKVSATNLSYNGTIAPGADTSFGFQGTWSASDAAPTGFTLNGAACG